LFKRQYADLEVFFTGPKGWGLRAKQDILTLYNSLFVKLILISVGNLSSSTLVKLLTLKRCLNEFDDTAGTLTTNIII
jgi:hypothetical protein